MLASFDLYGYVHDSLLGRAAYAPPATPFTGEYRVFDLWFGKPSPSLYGPLWFPIVQAVMWPATTLLGKMIAYRIFSAAMVVTFMIALRALSQPIRILAAVGLNPAFVFLTVANGHNDLIAVTILAGAAAFARGGSHAGYRLWYQNSGADCGAPARESGELRARVLDTS